MIAVMSALDDTREFWNANPCDAGAALTDRAAFRYRKEKWLLPVLGEIAKRHKQVLELGCGQGTDAVTLCHAGAVYTGIDCSQASLASARHAATKAGVTSQFELGDCELLRFPNGSIECIYSMGVLHHTSDTEQAVAEVHRVLRRGGHAYVALYRRGSPKLIAAHALRGAQWIVDRLIGRKRSLLWLSRLAPAGLLGTAVAECFGVPIMRSYSRRSMRTLFSSFTVNSLEAVGPQASFWLIKVQKP